MVNKLLFLRGNIRRDSTRPGVERAELENKSAHEFINTCSAAGHHFCRLTAVVSGSSADKKLPTEPRYMLTVDTPEKNDINC